MGLTVPGFWDLTPRELWATVDARRWEWGQRMEVRLTAVWAAEALARTKRLPQLEEWLHPKKKQTRSKAEVDKEFADLRTRMGGNVGR